MGSFDSGVRAAPVGEDKSFEAEVLLQHVGEQMTVLARKLSIHAIVGTHDSASVGDAESDLERTQIGFSHGPTADVCVDRIAAAFLVVDRVMLQIANHEFGLDTPDEVARQCAGKQWIFTLVFKGAPAAWLASQIHSAAQRHVVALVAELSADQRPILESCFWVPR